MAKEVIPSNPFPVKMNDSTIEDLYCASFLNYSEDSFSETSKELINYLENKYESKGLGGTTRAFIAKDVDTDDVYNEILNANIKGLGKDSFDKHVVMNKSDNDVILFTMLY